MARGRHRKDPGLVSALAFPLLVLLLLGGTASIGIAASMGLRANTAVTIRHSAPQGAPESFSRPRVPVHAPAASQPVLTAVRSYHVHNGDSLWKIAARFLGSGMKWGQLASVNHIAAPYTLATGEILKL